MHPTLSVIALIVALILFVVVAFGFDHPRFSSTRLLAAAWALVTLTMLI